MSKCRYDLSEDCNNTDCLNCVLDKIKAEIENYKLSEDELSDADEDSVKWGMKIAYDIIDKYKAERSDKCSKCEYHINPDYTRCHECKAESEGRNDG